jgi:hypothetical protein
MKKLILIAALFIGTKSFAQYYNDGIPHDSYAWHKTDKKYMIKTEPDRAYYQEVVNVDSALTQDQIYKGAKQFIAGASSSSLQLSYDDPKEGILVYTNTTGFTNTYGLEVEPFVVKYSVKVECKKGRYRYTIDNVEIAYAKVFIDAVKRVRLIDEYMNASDHKWKGNADKRLVVMERHFKEIINGLNRSVTQKAVITKGDF